MFCIQSIHDSSGRKIIRLETTPPRMGGDNHCHCNPCRLDSFNPRPRMGGDSRASSLCCPLSCFNPRPRMGGDEDEIDIDGLDVVSIHAPYGGGDRRVPIRPLPSPCFNPRPRMGGRRWGLASAMRQMQFQSTPPYGGRRRLVSVSLV